MGFAADLKALCDKAGEKAEMVVRGAALDLGGQMIDRSPVGNPDLWQANKQASYMRETYNVWVEAINADIGKGKGRLRKKSTKSLKKAFPNVVGKDYTGGRFKSNWLAATGAAMNTATPETTDPNGSATRAAIKQKLDGWKPGQTIWITNSLPYAQRLEYGWSKQAPGGIVRLAVQNYSQAIKKAADQVRGT